MNRGLLVAAAGLALGLLAASPACSHLDLTGEDYACTTSADCVAGSSCTSGVCRAGGADAGGADAGGADAGILPDPCSASCWAPGISTTAFSACRCLGHAYCADAFACGDDGHCSCGARKGDVPPDGRCKYNSQCADGFCSPWARGLQCSRNCSMDADCPGGQPHCYNVYDQSGGRMPGVCVTNTFNEGCLQAPPCANGSSACGPRSSDECSAAYAYEKVNGFGTCVCGKRGGADFGAQVMAPTECASGVAVPSPANPTQLLCTFDCARMCRAPLAVCNGEGYCTN